MTDLPLSLNNSDYNRNLVIFGQLPDSALPGNTSLYELWQQQVKDPLFATEYEILKANPVKEHTGLPGQYLDETFGLTGAPTKLRMVFVGDVKDWDSDIMSYLFSESRPRKISVIAEIPHPSVLSFETFFSVIANTGVCVIGQLDAESLQYLLKTGCFGSNSENIRNISASQYALQYSDERNLSIWDGSRSVSSFSSGR